MDAQLFKVLIFSPNSNDPFTFGQLRSILSDIYAMGGTPLFALNDWIQF